MTSNLCEGAHFYCQIRTWARIFRGVKVFCYTSRHCAILLSLISGQSGECIECSIPSLEQPVVKTSSSLLQDAVNHEDQDIRGYTITFAATHLLHFNLLTSRFHVSNQVFHKLYENANCGIFVFTL